MTWLTFLLPPALGAIIGYVTNALAIKMLFRPFTRKTFLGIPIPMTPGIIPRQRKSLAVNIGKMVSQKLLTQEVVLDHLETPQLQASIQERVEELTNSLLDWDLGRLSQLGDEGLFHKLIHSPQLEEWLEKGIKGILQTLGPQTFSQLLEKAGTQPDGPGIVAHLSRQENVNHLINRIQDALLQWVEEGHRVEDLISQDTLESLIRLIKRLWDPAGNLILYLISQEKTKRDLAVRGRFFLEDVLEKLNTMQKFFISAAQYDRTLRNNMPRIIEDFIHQIEAFFQDGEQQEILLENLRKYWNNHKDKTLEDITGLDQESLKWKILEGGEKVALGLRSFLKGPKIQKFLASQVEGFLHQDLNTLVRTLSGRTIGEISPLITGKIKDLLQEKGRTSLEGKTLGSLIPIEGQLKGVLDAQLTQWSITLLKAKAGGFLQGLDLQGLVERRIDSLDIEQVEELLLIVIKKHLKYINIFGAILGGIIGGSQVLLRFLGP